MTVNDRFLSHTIVGNRLGKFVLKHDDTFMVAYASSDLFGSEETGLFRQGTRFLHVCDLFLANQPLATISYSVLDNGRECLIDLCNIAPPINQEAGLDQGAISVRRHIDLLKNSLVETLTITSYHFGADTINLQLGLRIGADFRDIFEIQGRTRPARGEAYIPRISQSETTLSYLGLDNIKRETQVMFTPAADNLTNDGIYWDLQLTREQPVNIRVTTTMHEHLVSSNKVANNTKNPYNSLSLCEIRTDNILFDRLLYRGMNDLAMLCTETAYGLYPYGGIPWFVCPFGRDGLITSLQYLPWFPEVARGTLAFLSAYQGTKYDEFTEEMPGKILHEFRQGEMANCREVVYLPYYGTMDATLLFLIVFEAYIRWTNDLPFLKQHWANVEAAGRWITRDGDVDGDTFIEYRRIAEKGLGNQGWKDSGDAISHRDGRLAASPIALCEAQGYTFAAYRALSYMATLLNKQTDAVQWQRAAERLQANFLRSFWWQEEQLFYLALDGEKKPCEVVSSNAGQCLWTGIVPDTFVDAMVSRLMSSDMYCGWGIRTLSSSAARYNPMSYHNGSVWPHDTAFIGAGFARYGHKEETGRLLRDLLDASSYFRDARLPELFCGFERQGAYGPTHYPVACLPQSWASGAPFLLLSALLGLQPDAEHRRLVVHTPTLPGWMKRIELRHLQLGQNKLSLTFERVANGTNVSLMEGTALDIQVVPA